MEILCEYCTRNCLTFVKTTAIAYGQNLEAPGNFLPVCNSSRFYKRQEITSTRGRSGGRRYGGGREEDSLG